MFSGTVKLLDLNDYIKPGEECILPAQTKEGGSKKITLGYEGGNERPDLIRTDQEAGKISIADCLACSGCITSAESLLLEEQSLSKIPEMSKSKKIKFCLISPQSLASIGAYYKITTDKALRVIGSMLKGKFNVDILIDISAFIDLSSRLVFAEFQNKENKPLLTSECPGWVCYLEKMTSGDVVSNASKVKPPQLLGAEILRKAIITKYEIVSL